MNQEITIGVVGAGAITTQSHLPVITNLPSVRVGWIADVDVIRGSTVAAAFGIPFFNSADPSALPQCDVALLATPLAPRARFLTMFAERGTGVFVEKPFALTTGDHERYLSSFPAHMIGCGYMRRMYSVSRLLRQIVDECWFGELRGVRTAEGARVTKTGVDGSYLDLDTALGGGVLTDLGCHSLDLALFVAGGEALELQAGQVEWDGATDRKVHAQFDIVRRPRESASRCAFDFTVSWLDPQDGAIELAFEHATVSAPMSPTGRVRVSVAGGTPAVFEPQPSWATTSYQAFYLEWRAFLESVRTGVPGEMAASESLAVTRAIDSLLRPVKA